MAWRSSGLTNTHLISNLAENGLITSARVRKAMLAVDRAHYAPSAPYQDSPQPIGHAATISAPHMHAAAAEALLPFLGPGARVLDIGSGSGYLTHVFAALVLESDAGAGAGAGAGAAEREEGESGGRDRRGSESGGKESGRSGELAASEEKRQMRDGGEGEAGRKEKNEGLVVGLDHIQPLVKLAEGNMRKSKDGKELLESGQVRFVKGDGRNGLRMEGVEAWDAIHVGAAAVEVHEELIQQLARPGRMFIPVGNSFRQHIWVIDKKADGEVVREKGTGVKYVPLTDEPGRVR